ncbi:MAG: BON domain-containing protein [Planctomycetaceae bacterium]|jgi:hypothetical protein|nr:BON domain-containing protein [Planctomycetaceae bacterium]
MRLIIVTLVLVISLAIGASSPTPSFAQPTMSNQDAADLIAESLYGRFPTYDILVSYKNGNVELRGNVASTVMTRDVVEHVRNIKGVNISNIDNQLQVGRRGVDFISGSNLENTAIPRNNIPTPNRTAPTISPDTLATLNNAARPTTATPSPLTGRRYNGNESSPIIEAPMPIPERINNRNLLIASAERNPDYSNVLPPSLINPNPNPNAEDESINVNNYNNYNNYENNTRGVNPNYANNSYPNNPNRPDSPRPAFRPAVSSPLPLYAPPVNQNNYARNGVYYVANNNTNNANPYASTPNPAGYNPVPAPSYGGVPYYGATGPMPSAYNNPYLPPYAWPTYAAYPNYAQVSYPRSYSVQAWPYIGPFYPYPQAPLGWRQVTLKYDHARWWLDFNDGEPSGPLSPLFRQSSGYSY